MSNPITPEEIEKGRRLARRSSEGSWAVGYRDKSGRYDKDDETGCIVRTIKDGRSFPVFHGKLIRNGHDLKHIAHHSGEYMLRVYRLIETLERKNTLMKDALATLKVAVNDKQPDPGATNFIGVVLNQCSEIDKEAGGE